MSPYQSRGAPKSTLPGVISTDGESFLAFVRVSLRTIYKCEWFLAAGLRQPGSCALCCCCSRF
ncbi:hypothetical protein CHLRE_12g558352v5 [Chlamydomonas reinhardtii]|uniref:Uncharacterized protein n=1 Tax=Chlamydomonas reinhardtii TaxID=3055 RepID=A0A2K3D5N0_CHLRE|nr:uncharacterized protein CHLRE_12g558352v5 [Chlamydomonas reinhardtii]PNW75843.1 hypothetical protein CHLRE_12g558352v5 [Chlamydomonas reinhardtii]